ncbi:MAG TPA: hypothetical protein VF666_14135 [Pyrinomonadaceae bacterium]|jgi:hypothetical protein
MSADMKRRLARAGGWALAKRLIKPIPVIGTAMVVGLAARDMKKKGALLGALHVGLDVTPVIGTTKAIIEIFTGDLIPDKKPSNT